jgi:hypothetical protein
VVTVSLGVWAIVLILVVNLSVWYVSTWLFRKNSVLGLVQYLGVVSSVQMGLLMHGVEFCACLSRVEDMSGLAVFWYRRSSQYSIWCLSVCLKGGGGKWMEGESE